MEVTYLNQNPGAPNFDSSMEENDLNRRLSNCHLGRKKSPMCDSDVFWVKCLYEISHGW